MLTSAAVSRGLVSHLRRSDHLRDLSPALPGWAEVLTTGPPGLASIAIFAMSFFLNLLRARDNKGGVLTSAAVSRGLVPHLRRSDHLRDLSPALPGWAEVLTTGPPGLASIAIFAMSFFLNLLQARDNKGGVLTSAAVSRGLVPHLRRSDHLRDLSPALPGWAEVLTTGPPGLASIAIFAMSFFLNLLQAGYKGEGGAHLNSG